MESFDKNNSMGTLSFASELWLGSISHSKIVVKSGLLDMLEPSDAIMADKGIDISHLTSSRYIELIIPPKTGKRCKQKHMAALEIIETRIAAQRIHVEGYWSRVK